MQASNILLCFCALIAVSFASIEAADGEVISPVRFTISTNLTGMELNFPRSATKGKKVWPILPDGEPFNGTHQDVVDSYFLHPTKRDTTFEVDVSTIVPINLKGVPLEPSVASSGNYWFYTANWGACKR